jgi:adenosylhomocysteine nucleosidase
MKIGIIGAMPEETDLLKREMTVGETLEKANMIFFSGDLWGKKAVVVTCGIGKVNAAVCAQILCDRFNVDAVVNVGVAGGIVKGLMPGDVVVGKRLVQHDFDTSPIGDPIGHITGPDRVYFDCDPALVEKAERACASIKEHGCMTGTIATGDQFITKPERFEWIHKTFGAVACEMEGGSIAQTCWLNGKPFVVLRSISDNFLEGHIEYEEFKPIAAANSLHLLKGMLEQL